MAEETRQKVQNRITELKGEISSRQVRIGRIQKVLYNSQKLYEPTDDELKINSNNREYHSPDNWCSSELHEHVNGDIHMIMSFCKGHLRSIGDPLITGIVEIEDRRRGVFTFGEVYVPDLLSRILKRQLTRSEYFNYLSGNVPLAKFEGKEYFVERPENFDELVKQEF